MTAAAGIEDVHVDVLVLGGGVAGLWTHARLQQEGYKSVLLESNKLGAGQTRYAQGIIHGGTKYALTGKLTASSEAVADMPARWRACYEGTGELDLTQAELLSDAHYLWSTTSLTSRISGFFASKVMKSRSNAIDASNDKLLLPAVFQNEKFKGQFYRLDEPVFNTLSVVRALAEPRKSSILNFQKESIEKQCDKLVVSDDDGKSYAFHYKKIIFMAGEGNENLLSTFQLKEIEMQRRPLKMVVMRGGENNKLNDMIYAHCLGASVNPRITITSHRDGNDDVVWYMGGQLAEDGVNKTKEELIGDAQKELSELIPWLNLQDSQWGVLEINRAELKKQGTTRPDSFSIESNNNVITAWPTKMALSPALADALIEIIKDSKLVPGSNNTLPNWPKPKYADFPWNDNELWSV